MTVYWYRMSTLALTMLLAVFVLLVVGLEMVYSYVPTVALIELTKTVSHVPGQCAPTQMITVTYGTEVTYCYHMRNIGDVPLALHTLADSELGLLLEGFQFDVPPGEDMLFMETAVIQYTTVNTATWISSNATSGDEATASATATVIVQGRIRNVALIGVADQVDSLATPFVDSRQIKLLRRYPNPSSYLAEAPVEYFPTLPVNLALHLYEITTRNDEGQEILGQIIDASAAHDVAVEHTDLDWLSFVPAQLVLTGSCSNIVQIVTNLPGLGEPKIVDLEFPTDSPDCGDNQQIRLYPITNEQQVTVRVDAINDIATTVVAQPNHVMVGSPSEDYIAGSPAGPLLPQAQPWPMAGAGGSGKNVRVLIFDTVPFALVPGQTIQESYQGIPITVSYPIALPAELPVGGLSIAAHGTFVASAAMDVTPDAQYYLLKVLNDSGLGDEFTFIQAASQAITESLAVSQTLAGVVMNYSFVSEITPTLPPPAMTAFVAAVNDLNITQVAAVGNDSAIAPEPFPMLYPARHEVVLGVTAVTWNADALSCFANEGEIAIWGGGPGRGLDNCDLAAIVAQCIDNSHPEYCTTGWDPNSPTNYAYGLGTSFAAPLVTGLAAQDIAASTATLGNWPSPDTIRAEVHARVTHNPAPASIEIGAINNPYLVQVQLYLPFVME